jgi:putative transposase
MMFPAVAQISADGYPVRVVCRVLKVSPSSYYEWRSRPPSQRDVEDAYLIEQIRDVHVKSRQTYGSPRVHAELRLGLGKKIGRKRVERLMRCTGIQGVHRRRWRRGKPSPAVFDDHVKRQFKADAPDRLWFTDITQHRTAEGWVYCAVVLDVFSRRVVGWSIADHLRTELVADALDMARLQRKPPPQQTILHSDRGTQYTSWLFGKRMRDAGLMGSMGAVGSAYDNAAMESFFGSMQIELLDRRTWPTRASLAAAIFEWIEAFYNPTRRHSAIGYLSPVAFEALHTAAPTAA